MPRATPVPLDLFVAALRDRAPKLARVETVSSAPAASEDLTDFVVEASADVEGDRLVPPDAATCSDLSRRALRSRRSAPPVSVRELHAVRSAVHDHRDAAVRPRTDVDARVPDVRRLPTGVRGSRRPAVPRRARGVPGVRPTGNARRRVGHGAGRAERRGPGGARRGAAAMLRAGAIVALKGLGGFHLACDATSEDAVALLRKRKRRPDKPFAVMVPDVAAATSWFDPTEAELEALTSWRAPIVLVADRGRLAPSVAPGHRRQGAMLPATPLHHLLLREARIPLVMTSGNVSDEPICIENDDALDASRGDRRRVPDPRPPGRRPLRRLGRARADRRRRAQHRAPRAVVRAATDRVGDGAPGRRPGHRRAAPRCVLSGPRAARVPVAAHRRSRDRGGDGRLRRRLRPVARGLPDRARARRARPPPRPADDALRRGDGSADRRRAAPSRARRGDDGRARARRRGPRARLRRPRLR